MSEADGVSTLPASAKNRVRSLSFSEDKRCVAEWFSVPQAIVTILQTVFGVILVTLMITWRSRGIGISNFINMGESIDYRNFMICYLGVALLTILYSLAFISVGLLGIHISAIMHTSVTGVCLLLWLISSSFISSITENIDNSLYARSIDLDLFYIKLANVFGFLEVGTFVVDIFLALQGLDSPLQHEHADKQETEKTPPTYPIAVASEK